jgi:hypothetical protein
MQPQHVIVSLLQRQASVRLKLRWDNSPETCQTLIDMLPLTKQIWHAKYANNEVYMIVESPKILPPPEWQTVYPAPGDLLYIPLPYGMVLSDSLPKADRERGLLDLAYFYDRGSSVQNGPFGPLPGTIVATATDLDEVERMAVACNDVWFKGAYGETLSIAVG